jgi:hypothetical protein
VKALNGGLYEDDPDDLVEPEPDWSDPDQEDEEPEDLSGELKWPQPDGESNNHQQLYRQKYRDPEDVAAGLDGEPLAPQDFLGSRGKERAEREVGMLYQLIFDRPVNGVKPEWLRTWQLSAARDPDGTVQVERVTYYPVMRSLQDISADLHEEGICVRTGKNAGKAILQWQVQEWKQRVGLKVFEEYFFDDHPDVLNAYVAKLTQNGEAEIDQTELRKRFAEGLWKLLAGQKSSSPSQ